MRFHALVGILEHERTISQPIEIDARVWCAAGAPIVDYRRLYEAARAVVESGPIDYLEDVAERVARGVLEDRWITQARVAVRKPHVTLPGPLTHAEVVVVRRRPTGSR
jgi:dihydroneopterin aldolase